MTAAELNLKSAITHASQAIRDIAESKGTREKQIVDLSSALDAMPGVSAEKVLTWIRAGELLAFNAASKRGMRAH